MAWNHRSLPTEDNFSITSADRPSLLRSTHALPRGLSLLHQHLQHGPQWAQHASLVAVPHLPSAAILKQPKSKLPVQLLPVLRHRLWLLSVLHGGPGQHWRRALPHPPAVLLGGHRRDQQPDEPRSEHPERRGRGGRQPQQLPHSHECLGTPRRVCVEALLTPEREINVPEGAVQNGILKESSNAAWFLLIPALTFNYILLSKMLLPWNSWYYAERSDN